jgi:ubiquinone biosynthesis accessory factor UbiK
MTMDTKRLDELARKLAELVPPGVRGIGDELERNFKAVLTSTFARLDLVTREEFELQQALLARTREKLDGLIGRLAELELELAAAAPPKKRAKKATKKKAAAKDDTSRH